MAISTNSLIVLQKELGSDTYYGFWRSSFQYIPAHLFPNVGSGNCRVDMTREYGCGCVRYYATGLLDGSVFIVGISGQIEGENCYCEVDVKESDDIVLSWNGAVQMQTDGLSYTSKYLFCSKVAPPMLFSCKKW